MTLWTYPLIMAFAIAAGGLLLRRSQARLPLTWSQKLGLGIGGFCGAMIGAKLPFALTDWDGLVAGTAWFADGKTIMCGIAGGYLGVEVAKWTLGIHIKTGDTFAVPVAVAVALGRVACFFGGCCYGQPTSLPWGVCFPTAPDGGTIARHPTQLYEAAFHLACAGVLLLLQRRGLFQGQLIKLYILVYLGYRFITEFIRPEHQFWLGLTIYQWAAIVLAPIFVLLWWRDALRAAATPA
jgi:phosphatidylglycerol:prolipoprotein diacylglycerol transferase